MKVVAGYRKTPGSELQKSQIGRFTSAGTDLDNPMKNPRSTLWSVSPIFATAKSSDLLAGPMKCSK